MIKQLKVVACLVGVLVAPSLFANETIQGKTSSGTVKEVQVNSSGQVVIAPLSLENQTDGIGEVKQGPFEFEEIAASATDQKMGVTGGVGDYLDHCTIVVVTSATGTSGIEDGTNTAFDDISTTAANTPIGVYNVEIHAVATTSAGWEITTGAGATAHCYGIFTD
jgi:hypothetical protein